jgi:hypothetical protein
MGLRGRGHVSIAPVAPNTAEPLELLAVDTNGAALTGVTTLVARVRRRSDGFFYDWSDSTFKTAASVTTITGSLSEVSATYAPGLYSVSWPGAAAGGYDAIITQSSGSTVANVPATIDLRIGQIAAPGDAMALTSGERTTVQALIVSDATPFLGARIDVAISSRSTLTAAQVDTQLSGVHGAGSWATATGFAVPGNIPSAAANADAVWDELLSGHAGAGSAGAALALVDVAVSSRATNAGVWATAEGTPSVGTFGYDLWILFRGLRNRIEASTASSGTEILYADDGTTPLLTWSLRDGTGAAITTPSGSPARRGAAT